MICPNCNHIFELKTDEVELAKKILFLAGQGKKEEIELIVKNHMPYGMFR